MAKKREERESKEDLGKLSKTPFGTPKGKPSKFVPEREPKPEEYLEDVRLDDIITPELPPAEDVEVEDMGKLTKQLLQTEKTKFNPKPLSPKVSKSKEDELEDIIKSVEKEVDTAQNVNGKPNIDDSDRTSEEDLIDKITKQEKEIKVKFKPIPVKVVKAIELDERDRVRLEQEEQKRRELDKARALALSEAIDDENERRLLFDAEIQQQKKEFQFFLDDKFPEFSKRNSKNLQKFSPEEIKQQEIDLLNDKKQVALDKERIKEIKKALQTKKVVRLKAEQIRKAEEGDFKVNRIRKSEVHTFFEGDVLLEQKEKAERNPDINNETEVQTKLREIALMERKLGRKIVPHRDIVESEESDFDLNSDISPDDILIVVPKDNEPLKQYNKLNKLLNIRKTLDIDKSEDIDYIKTKNKERSEEVLYRKSERN